MSLIRRVAAWIGELFAPSPVSSRVPERVRQPEAPVLFPSTKLVEKPPRNEDIVAGRLYCIVKGGTPRWALFQCPCRCGNVVTLSLQPVHRPHWRLTHSHAERPTLHPSVWRDKGCLSHFWLRDGRVSWCSDTGTHPNHRELQ